MKRKYRQEHIETIKVSYCEKCKRPTVCTHEDGLTYCLIHDGDLSRHSSLPAPAGPNPTLSETPK